MQLPEACGTREAPSWFDMGDASCPLQAGGMLKCYYRGNDFRNEEGYGLSVDEKNINRFHGCGSESDARAFVEAESARSLLSAYVRELAGDGPPNPFCMTLFPPSWRVEDWASGSWLTDTSNQGGTLLIVSFILFPIFSAPGVACIYFAHRSLKAGTKAANFRYGFELRVHEDDG